VGGESGLLDVRDRACSRSGRQRARRVDAKDIWPASSSKVLSFVDVEAIKPLRWSSTRPTGWRA
jgi:hypothetical protein